MSIIGEGCKYCFWLVLSLIYVYFSFSSNWYLTLFLFRIKFILMLLIKLLRKRKLVKLFCRLLNMKKQLSLMMFFCLSRISLGQDYQKVWKVGVWKKDKGRLARLSNKGRCSNHLHIIPVDTIQSTSNVCAKNINFGQVLA